MVNIVKLTKEDFNNHSKSKNEQSEHRIRDKKIPYSIRFEKEVFDDMFDVNWNSEGYTQSRFLLSHIEQIVSEYGHFSEVTTGPNKPTSVNYQTIFDIDGNEIKNARGRHPAFYDGWRSAALHRQITASKFDLMRSSQHELLRFWIMGYTAACKHMVQGVSVEESVQSHPYIHGVISALEDYLAERKRTESGEENFIATLLSKGYNETYHMLSETRFPTKKRPL